MYTTFITFSVEKNRECMRSSGNVYVLVRSSLSVFPRMGNAVYMYQLSLSPQSSPMTNGQQYYVASKQRRQK